MGHNLPKQLILNLRDAAKIKNFIETGTYKAQTALWAARHFEQVYTIEALVTRYTKTIEGLPKPIPDNIEFIFGDSRLELAEVLARLVSPAIIWLDAHWIGDSPVDAKGECPLLEELAAINDDFGSDRHMILIDDARLFTDIPPHPHDINDWPRLQTFISKIGTGIQRRVVVQHDMIVSVPKVFSAILDRNWY